MSLVRLTLRGVLLVFLVTGCNTPLLACDLKVTDAWIREAPPTAMVLAGYATLSNAGHQALQVTQVQSPAFAAIELHESVMTNGVASMRAIDKLTIAAQDTVAFAPNGKHFMLMGLQRPLKRGDSIVVKFEDDHACTTTARFVVRAAQ